MMPRYSSTIPAVPHTEELTENFGAWQPLSAGSSLRLKHHFYPSLTPAISSMPDAYLKATGTVTYMVTYVSQNLLYFN